MRSNFAPLKQFCTLCETQESLPISLFRTRSRPYESLLIFLCNIAISPPLHSIPSPARISFRRDALYAPSKHKFKQSLPFLTWHGAEELLPPLHRDAPWGREPPQLKCQVFPLLRPRRPRGFHLPKVERPLDLPHLLISVGTWRGDHLLPQERLLRTSRVQYGVIRPRGPELQVVGSHLKLLSLRSILSYLLTCHQSGLSDVRCSQHCPLRATQIAKRDLFTPSYILIRRPCDNSLSSKTRTTYSRGTTLSTSWLLVSFSILE